MKNTLKKFLLCLLALSMLSSLCVTVAANGESTQTLNFITVDGQKLYDGDEEFILKGMSFANGAIDDGSGELQLTHHDEQSYAELANLGFNSVRFYLSYKFFEDDSNPDVYKQSGWDWLDQNVEWAKKYGIRLVLNMHTPQGGYQSLGNGWALWTGDNAQSNQTRLKNLWVAIATRYAKEQTIVGYGLINEPIVPWNTDENTSLAQYKTLMDDITSAIRVVDNNHIIFAERVLNAVEYTIAEDGSVTIGTKHSALNDTNNFVKLNDKKVVYELHTYAPSAVTHGEMSWNETTGKYAEYPNEGKQFYGNTYVQDDEANDVDANKKFTSSGSVTQWTKVTSGKVQATGTYNQAAVTLSTPKGSTAYFDSIVVTEYESSSDSEGTVIATYNFDRNTVFSSWGGTPTYMSEGGVDNTGYLKFDNVTEDYGKLWCEHDMLYITSGRYYSVSGYIKADNVDVGYFDAKYVRISLDFQTAANAAPRTKETLQTYMKSQLAFGTTNEVPMYVGEFGTSSNSFENELGGEQWVTDMIDIFTTLDISFNYHTYHEGDFGLWRNAATSRRDNYNQLLANVFRSHLAKVSYVGYQTKSDGNGKCSVRFVASIDSTNYKNVGFDISTVNFGDKSWGGSTTNVYRSILGEKNDGTYTITAEEWASVCRDDEAFLYTYTLTNVPDDRNVYFVVKPYYTDKDGNKVYGATYIAKLGDGLTVATQADIDEIVGEGSDMVVPW